MTTRVLFDEATLHGRWQSGIGRYVRHIAAAAAAHYGSGLLVCSPRRLAAAPSRWIPVPRFRGSGRLRVQDAIVTSVSAFVRPRLYYGSYYGAVRTSAPRVFTVYDLIHDRYAPANPDRMLRRALDDRRRCFERAAALIAISHSTAADIQQLYPFVDPAKIYVTHLGVDESFFRAVAAPVRSKPYFLYVGIRAGVKNFRRLVEAFAKSGLARELDLAVASPGVELTAEELELIRVSGLTGSVRLQQATDDAALAALYARAVAFVYPSEYEGFGLPILEAMAAGTLVATSNTSSMPEAGGSHAIYFDPLRTEEIAAALRRIASMSGDERAARIDAAREWARTFTWSRCASRTMAIFDAIMAR